jgi:hypothetical protein
VITTPIPPVRFVVEKGDTKVTLGGNPLETVTVLEVPWTVTIRRDVDEPGTVDVGALLTTTVVNALHVKVVTLVLSRKTPEISAAVAPKNDPVRVSVAAPVGGTTNGTTELIIGARNGVVIVAPVEGGLCPSEVLNRSV